MRLSAEYLSSAGVVQGLILAGLLLFSAKVNTASRILGLWCLVLALNLLGAFIYTDQQLNMFSSLIGWTYFLPASYGALLYLYCKHALVKQPLASKDWLHLLPVLTCYLLNIDILFAPPEVKLVFITTRPPATISFYLSQWLLFTQAYVYLTASMLLLARQQNHANATRANFHPNIFKWLWILLALSTIIWLLKTLPSLISGVAALSSVATGLIVVLIYAVAIVQWRYPDLFRVGIIEDTIKEEDLSQVDTNQLLSTDAQQQLCEKLRQQMQAQRWYLDSQLTLPLLAEKLGFSTHYISEAINQFEGQNFYQLINHYRIEYFCQQLSLSPTQNLLELAFASGFSAKSTFNAVFKQKLGCTPSEYRRQLLTKQNGNGSKKFKSNQ